MKEVIAYVGLGGNLGRRRRSLSDAMRLLGQTRNVRLCRASAFVETTPLGDVSQRRYYNCVAEISTTLVPEALLKELQTIEVAMGRERGERWGPRNIDLDLVLFGSQVIDTRDLKVPHPQMHLRSFVLDGLRELNPGIIHPVLKETIAVLARRLNGGSFVFDASLPQLICLTGNIGAGKTTLATKLAEALACELILEKYDTNPYLAKVYAGDKSVALDSELYFLKTRSEQLMNLRQARIYVADYLVQKQRIYASLLLAPQQLASFDQAYEQALRQMARPVLIVHVQQGADVCLDRIHSRNRPYEQEIQADFLDSIAVGYDTLLAAWKTCPVIRLAEFDCLREEALRHVIDQVRRYVAPESLQQAGK